METLKENSDFLRHPLMSELVSENTNINEEAGQLMKFHGSYQQDDREKRTMGQGKFYQFMMRTKQPAGCVSNQLYLTMDDLANEVNPHIGSLGPHFHKQQQASLPSASSTLSHLYCRRLECVNEMLWMV